jgi:transposase
MRFEIPEDTLPRTHPARVLFEVVGQLDLSGFTADTKSVSGRAGRPVLSPRMKLTLWLYGISRGIGSAREIERLTREDDGFRWIVGDLAVSHGTLSSFRVGHEAALDQLMTDVLASLLHKGLVSLETVAQDGTRVRASASAPSFRQHGSLLKCREQAALHLKAVLADAENPEHDARVQASREAAARDFQARVEAAIESVETLQAAKRPSDKKPARASTTDVEARVMKMPDGGFRPGYNVQFAVAGSEMGGARTLVGLRVTNVGSDMGSITPMLGQIEQRTGLLPGALLADANHVRFACIEGAANRGVEVLIPVPENSNPEMGGPAIEAWRARMETDGAKRRFRARAGLVELLNAHLKEQFGVDHVFVRGLSKVNCVALLAGLTFNLLQHAASLLA